MTFYLSIKFLKKKGEQRKRVKTNFTERLKIGRSLHSMGMSI